jgi:electron transport complex protein RnfB
MATASTPTANPARKPKPLALIYKDYCTSCEACIQMCPIKDCIVKTGDTPDTTWCVVVPQKCIGCTLCVQICPWDCIEMLPREQYPQGVFTGAPGDIMKPPTAA